MTAGTQHRMIRTLQASLALVAVLLVTGCGGSDDPSTDPSASYAASQAGDANGVPPKPAEPGTESARETAQPGGPGQQSGQTFLSVEGQPNGATGSAPSPPASNVAPSPFGQPGMNEQTPVKERRELKADLSPHKLVEFLAGADIDMQRIMTGRSGIEDPQKARVELLRIVKLKLEASRRLIDHADAKDEQQVEGARGQLQALSHMAALGDLKSAEELEKLAEKNLDSDDGRLAADSRLVLVGFAVESLQNGKEGAAAKIVTLVNGFSPSSTSSDVPALMAMGQARQILFQYGQNEEAMRIRDKIISLFADSPDPNVAKMAAEIAGNVQYDEIDKMLIAISEGAELSPKKWQDAVETLIAESADLQTVQYLAGAALEFEAMGKDELVIATYESLTQHFGDPTAATGREVELAMNAREARRQIIGRPFDLDLPGVGSTPPQIEDYRGKVVLVPFWATGFPDSLGLLPQLQAIRDASPEDVAILGMNLDVEGTPVDDFVKTNGLGFDSYFAASSPTAKVANPVAAQFGMVSMPFLVLLDQKGHVAAVKLTGDTLEEDVKKLVDGS